jgi:hypothetical protein
VRRSGSATPARCSTTQQELQSQLDALERSHCTRVFSEKISTRSRSAAPAGTSRSGTDRLSVFECVRNGSACRPSEVTDDAFYGLIQTAGRIYHLLAWYAEQIASLIPLPHLLRRDDLRQWPRGMSSKRLVERQLEVVHACRACVVSYQLPHHRAIGRAIEDAVQNHVIAVIERIPRRLVDQADVRSARTIVFSQQDPAQIVLFDPSNTAPDPSPNLLRRGGLARPRVASKNNKSRRRIPKFRHAETLDHANVAFGGRRPWRPNRADSGPALKIGDTWELAKVSDADWAAVGSKLGLGRDAAVQRARDLRTRIPTAIQQAAAETQIPERLRDRAVRIADLVSAHVEGRRDAWGRVSGS